MLDLNSLEEPNRDSLRKGTTILVVEDSPEHVTLIKAVIRMELAGSQVHVAPTIMEARRYLTGEWPCDDRSLYPLPTLIVLDGQLPDGSGFEILEWLAQRKGVAEIPVIMFTSSTNPEHAKRAYALGARRYMQKPADFREFVTAVKEILDRGMEPELDS